MYAGPTIGIVNEGLQALCALLLANYANILEGACSHHRITILQAKALRQVLTAGDRRCIKGHKQPTEAILIFILKSVDSAILITCIENPCCKFATATLRLRSKTDLVPLLFN